MQVPTDPRIMISRLQVTPMIDVVFLLLAFFMLGMQFRVIDRELEAALPRGASRPGSAPVEELRIRITTDGTAAVPARPRVVIDQLSLTHWGQVYHTLRRLAEAPGARATYQVVIAPEDDVPHDWVMRVFDYLKLLGYTRIGLSK